MNQFQISSSESILLPSDHLNRTGLFSKFLVQKKPDIEQLTKEKPLW